MMVFVDSKRLSAVCPKTHFRHWLIAEITNKLRSTGVDVWCFELEYDLKSVPFPAVVCECDQISRAAHIVFLASLTFGQIVGGVWHLPLGFPA
jgi:hypothetical protein